MVGVVFNCKEGYADQRPRTNLDSMLGSGRRFRKYATVGDIRTRSVGSGRRCDLFPFLETDKKARREEELELRKKTEPKRRKMQGAMKQAWQGWPSDSIRRLSRSTVASIWSADSLMVLWSSVQMMYRKSHSTSYPYRS